ncbi:MAG: serine/threonine-protein phosphatase [Saprospiraceae bacterium]|nr:serine/threonine-protein phosphatase [Saprospiraceae bacterium]
MFVHHHALSDKGKSRNYQEDDWMVLPKINCTSDSENGTLKNRNQACSAYIVADGMGGAVGGDIASHLAVVSVSEYLTDHLKEFNAETIQNVMESAIVSANNVILAKVAENSELFGMGSTIVLGIIYEGFLYLAWIGDSRCYLYNKQTELRLISKDHSYVQSLVDQGVIDEGDAASHPNKNIILKSLGQPQVQSEFLSRQLNDDDILLFCSDGLNSMISDIKISSILSDNVDLETMATQLITSANDGGGLDNITVILVKCDSSNLKDQKETPAKKLKAVPGMKSGKNKLTYLLNAVLVFLIVGGLWYYNKSQKTQSLDEEISLTDVQPDFENEAELPLKENGDEILENSIQKVEFTKTESSLNNVAVSYEVRIGVYSELMEVERLMTNYKSSFPNISFELRTNNKSNFELFATKFDNKRSAEDFLASTKNENGIIIFNKFSQNE